MLTKRKKEKDKDDEKPEKEKCKWCGKQKEKYKPFVNPHRRPNTKKTRKAKDESECEHEYDVITYKEQDCKQQNNQLLKNKVPSTSKHKNKLQPVPSDITEKEQSSFKQQNYQQAEATKGSQNVYEEVENMKRMIVKDMRYFMMSVADDIQEFIEDITEDVQSFKDEHKQGVSKFMKEDISSAQADSRDIVAHLDSKDQGPEPVSGENEPLVEHTAELKRYQDKQGIASNVHDHKQNPSTKSSKNLKETNISSRLINPIKKLFGTLTRIGA